MSIYEASLPTGRDALTLHNATQAVENGQAFLTDPTQWSYAVSRPIEIPKAPAPDWVPTIVVDVQVLQGSIGVGVMDADLRQFLTSEVDVRATGRPASVELRLDTAGTSAHLMVRNTAPHGLPARFRLLGAALRFAARDNRLLVPRPCPEVPGEVHAAPALSGTFDLLVSHSSRTWNAAQCARGYLEDRYARPDRLTRLPAFEDLPPNTAPYHGLLSVFRLELSPSGVAGRVMRHYESPEKVVHACPVGDEVVVCFDAGIALFPRRDAAHLDVDPDQAERVIDPWFGGLHTVIPAGEDSCLVSSSGADAILWLDVPRRRVVRRWRLPASRYGANYPLDETTWLSEHYIPNDLQLGHLNCAAPDGRGGVFCSVLGQGDIGRVDADGGWELIVAGFVGCHGVRYDSGADLLYFSDSCGGRLMGVDGRGRTSVLFDAGSRWLHDAVHLAGGLFLLTLGDRNRLVLADTGAGRTIAEWDFTGAPGTLQFLSV